MPSTAKSSNPTSIAVLPFVNMSSQGENEFFCDGITEEIINALTKIPQLKVTSRTSSFVFKGSSKPISEIAQQLGVATILEGSVRVGGEILRITAQLINVDDDAHFWSDTWDRPKTNVFEVQDEISLLIAEKLREHYGHLEIDEHLVEKPTQSLSAYEHLLKGRHLIYKWNPTDTNKAIEEFDKAVEIDPQLIDAHLGLADSYSFLAVAGFAPREEAWKKAQEAIAIAKKIDANNAGLNYMLGNEAFFTQADFGEAMHYGIRALQTKPNHSESHRFMSFLYSLNGNLKKSEEHILFAKSADPLNQETLFFEANYYYRSHQFEKAYSILSAILKLNPQNLPALAVMSYILLLQKKWEKAKTHIESIPKELIAPDERAGLLDLLAVYQGEKNPPHLKELAQKIKDPFAHHAHSYLFLIYANLGNYKKAFEVLNNLFEFKSSVLLLGFSDPLAGAIKNDPTYQTYFEKIYKSSIEKVKLSKIDSSRLSESESKAFEEKLKTYTAEEEPFLNPALTLRQLANEIDLHPNKLSWLLNEYMGINYNNFINQFRINHFKKLVVNPDNNHISLIGLAYESGFNSKTVFNTTFKKLEGQTPKQFQKNNLN